MAYYVNTEISVKKGGRNATKMSKDDFIAKALEFESKYGEDYESDEFNENDFVNTIVWYALDNPESKLGKDFKGIEFDAENALSRGLESTKSSIPYIRAFAGGDWQYPLDFFIYHDGKQFRVYVPTKGNAYRKDIKRVFGDNEDLSAMENEGAITDGEYLANELLRTGQISQSFIDEIKQTESKYCKENGYNEEDSESYVYSALYGALINELEIQEDMIYEDFFSRIGEYEELS